MSRDVLSPLFQGAGVPVRSRGGVGRAPSIRVNFRKAPRAQYNWRRADVSSNVAHFFAPNIWTCPDQLPGEAQRGRRTTAILRPA